MIPYKHTGKAATFKLQVDVNKNGQWGEPGDISRDVVLRANAYAEVSFQVP